LTIIRKIDWTTLIFFASMFILMACVWNSGVFQKCHQFHDSEAELRPCYHGHQRYPRQFISNVPLVALYLPMLMKSG